MRISRWAAAAAVGAAGALALAGPAWGQLDGAQLDVRAAQVDDDPPPTGATYSLSGCEFSVGWQSEVAWSVWLVVDVDGSVHTTEVPAGEIATSDVVDLTAVTELRWRIFGGPERDADSPLWDTEGHPDWVDTVTELEAAEGRPWGAADDAEFVTWHTVSIPAECESEPEPTPTATAPAGPSDPPADEGEGGGKLPETGSPTLWLAAGGAGALGLGVGLVQLARRRRTV